MRLPQLERLELLESDSLKLSLAFFEGLADRYGVPNEDHVRLYRRWAEGNLGLSITGNVQIDRHHLERPGNVALWQ